MTSAKRSKAVDALMQGALKAAQFHPAEYLEGKRVLIVDDDSTFLNGLAEMVRAMGGDDLEISTARSFNAAMDICLSHDGEFELVLLSQTLGRRHTGLELLGQLWRAGLPRTALTVLFTEGMSPDLMRAARAAGFSDAVAAEDLDEDALFALLVQHWEAP